MIDAHKLSNAHLVNKINRVEVDLPHELNLALFHVMANKIHFVLYNETSAGYFSPTTLSSSLDGVLIKYEDHKQMWEAVKLAAVTHPNIFIVNNNNGIGCSKLLNP